MGFLNTAKLGFFGKVPTTGDFVAKNVDRGLRDLLDQWLQASLVQSRNELGEGWLQTYLTSPIWRFIISAEGVDGLAFGLMIPSVDKAGRYFPFTILGQSQPPFEAKDALALDRFLDELEPLILTALDEDFDLDHFGFQLANINRAMGRIPEAAATISGILETGQNAFLEVLTDRAASVWWTNGSELKRAERLEFHGLPPHNAYGRMLRDPDIFAEHEALWRDLRDLAPTQVDNGSIEVNRTIAGVEINALTHSGGTGRKSLAYAQLLTDPPGILIADGRAGAAHHAMASRFVANAVPRIFDQASTEEIDEELGRVAAFLQSKSKSDRVNLLSPLSFGLIKALEQPGLFNVTIAGEYVCMRCSSTGAHQLYPVSDDSAETSTIRKSSNDLYVSFNVQLATGEVLLVASSFFLTVASQDDAGNVDDPYLLIRSKLEAVLLNGKGANHAIGAVTSRVT